jgi:PPE-repeat protein
VTPLEGYEVNSVRASFDSGDVSSSHNSHALDTGDTTKTLTNDTVKNYYVRTTSDTWVTAMSFTGFNPGQSVDISIAAYKNASGTGSIGEYTTDGGINTVTLDASNDNTGTHVLTIPSTADDSGAITLQFRKAPSGTGYAYLNGILLEPQADQADRPIITASMYGSDFVISWEGGGSYTVLTNADLTNANGWGILTSGTSPITIAVGSEAVLFYKLSE